MMMIDKARIYLVSAILVLLAMSTITISGCASGSHASKGAAEGATTGAVAGAVGGMVTALVFGGDVVEAGARGAVYGGTTGAVVGGMSGSKADQAELEKAQAQREAELAKIKKRIGTDAYNGVVALAECKHDIAIANAREAASSSNSDYALAGTWIEVLAEADRQRETQAQALFPELIKRDRDISTEQEASARMNQALQELGATRVEYNLPKGCPS
jgi:hypothetical protein